MPKVKKNILELESVKQQLDLIFGLPDEEAFLRYTLKDLNQTGNIFREIMTAWLAGDAQAMYENILAPLENEAEAQPMLETIFYQRNHQMTNKIKTLMQSHKDLFIVVGSGHLLGDKGILKRLEQAGYSIQQQ